MRGYDTVSLALALTATIVVVKAQAPGPTQSGTASSCNKWHIVKGGDTCGSLETTYKISHADFLKWNPAVSNDCLTNFWPDYAYCVGVVVGGITSTTTTPTPTSSSTSRVTTPAGPTHTGIPANCNSWYVVQADESCSTVETRFNITHSQFLAWNPAVSQDCQQNFWPSYAYCVGVDPNAPATRSTTSASSTITSVSESSTPYSTRHPVTSETISTPVVPTEWPPTKTQAGQPSYCNDWHLVLPGESCEKIVQDNSAWMGLEDFYAWNPAVGTDCSGLYLNWYVCVGIRPQVQVTVPWELGYDGNGTTELPPYVSWPPFPEPTVDFNFTPTPTQGPLPDNCQAWYKTIPNDNCRKIVAQYSGITQAQFLAWHPFLNGNCDGLWSDYYYCVWAAANGSMPPVPTLSTQPSPVPSGISSDCKGWYQATALDECDEIVAIFGTFSLEEFVRWNPAVGTTTSCSLLEGYGYCIAVPGTLTSRTSGIPPSTTISTTSTSSGGGAGPTATPTPIQPGMVTGCSRFYLVHAGDGCWAIANSAGIDLNNFYAWNPAVKTDCSGLWPDYYVCIGVGGTTTTIT